MAFRYLDSQLRYTKFKISFFRHITSALTAAIAYFKCKRGKRIHEFASHIVTDIRLMLQVARARLFVIHFHLLL